MRACRLCFKAKEVAKAARAARRRGESITLPAIAKKRGAGAIKKGSSGGGSSGNSGGGGGGGGGDGGTTASFATVGETLWPITSPTDVAKLARHVEASRSAHVRISSVVSVCVN